MDGPSKISTGVPAIEKEGQGCSHLHTDNQSLAQFPEQENFGKVESQGNAGIAWAYGTSMTLRDAAGTVVWEVRREA